MSVSFYRITQLIRRESLLLLGLIKFRRFACLPLRHIIFFHLEKRINFKRLNLTNGFKPICYCVFDARCLWTLFKAQISIRFFAAFDNHSIVYDRQKRDANLRIHSNVWFRNFAHFIWGQRSVLHVFISDFRFFELKFYILMFIFIGGNKNSFTFD